MNPALSSQLHGKKATLLVFLLTRVSAEKTLCSFRCEQPVFWEQAGFWARVT